MGCELRWEGSQGVMVILSTKWLCDSSTMRGYAIRENKRDKTACQRMSLTNDCDLK